MKKCPGCGVAKPLTDYYVSKNERDGRQARCKACQQKYARDHRDRGAQRAAEWRKKRRIPKGPAPLFKDRS